MASPKTAQLVTSDSSSSAQLPANASPANNLPEVTSDGFLPPALRLTADLIDSNPDLAAEILDRRVAFLARIKTASLKITNTEDWINMGGKPYLQATGCEKLMAVWGIFIKSYTMIPTVPEAQRMFRDGIPVAFSVEGYAGCRTFSSDPDHVSKFFAGRNSDDDFFRVRYEGEGDARHKVRRPMTEIDVLDVAKSAFSNFKVHVVTEILGIRNMTWNELKAHDIKAGGKVEFKKGTTPKVGTPPPPDAPRQSSDTPKPTDQTPAATGGAPLDLDLRRDYVMEVIGAHPKPDLYVGTLTKGSVKTHADLAEAIPAVIDRLYDRLKK